MILFKPEHKDMILNGTKIETRRVGKKRWNVGSIHQCKLNFKKDSLPFALVEIVCVQREKLGYMGIEDAKAEGYNTLEEYKYIFIKIYGMWQPDLEVWVVRFRLKEKSE